MIDLFYFKNSCSNSRIAFIFIYHTTKEGNFRGKKENAHEVDVIIEVVDGKATGNGRFGIGGGGGVLVVAIISYSLYMSL